MTEDTAQQEKNQDFKDTHAPNGWGGRRPNAGRPKGSRDKLKVSDFFTPEEKERLVQEAKMLTIDSEGKPDKDMVKFLWEQLFGKATQRLEHAGDDENPLVLAIAEDIVKKHAINSKTERDS